VPCAASPLPFSQEIGFLRDRLTWESPARVDVVEGDLDALRASQGQYQGTVLGCREDSALTTGASPEGLPPPGSGRYYLVRAEGLSPGCAGSWGTRVPQELPGAGGDRDADLALDPDTCP
jgi:hypothetical protein